MFKKTISIGVLFTMLFLLAGCGDPTVKFESLDEMKAAISEEFYYFEFEGIDFSKTGNFVATKFSKGSSVLSLKDGYYRYTISFDIDNPVTDKTSRFKVIGTHYRRLFVPSERLYWGGAIADLGDNGVTISEPGFFQENRKKHKGNFILNCWTDSDHDFNYHFIMERKQQPETEEAEMEFFISVCKSALDNCYLANRM